jgi:glycerophosphoryl diester phosphodiesterase
MTIIVGHRGVGTLLPENSLAAFQRAVDFKLEGVEFDVHRSRDGALFVIHDPYLDRTSDRTGFIQELDANAIREARLGETEERVPYLNEVLDVLGPSGAELHLEFKTDGTGTPYPGLEKEVIAEIDRRGLADRTIYTCFAPAVLKQVRLEKPSARVLGSINRTSVEAMGGLDSALDQFLEIPGCYLAVEKTLMRFGGERIYARIDRDHLGVWIVDKRADVEHWIEEGIRQITTNRPELHI